MGQKYNFFRKNTTQNKKLEKNSQMTIYHSYTYSIP